MTRDDNRPKVKEYVRNRLADADPEVLRALIKADSPLSTRARRALEYLDEHGQTDTEDGGDQS